MSKDDEIILTMVHMSISGKDMLDVNDIEYAFVAAIQRGALQLWRHNDRPDIKYDHHYRLSISIAEEKS